MKKLLLTKEFPNGKLVDMTAAEIAVKQAEETTWNNGAFDRALEDLRLKRNKLLADSDWEVIMAKEKGTTLSAGFKTYRQELRDLTEGLTTVAQVEAVVFPTKP